jgi:cytosine/adenosine deaminase-related metal-dependent hydrolase
MAGRLVIRGGIVAGAGAPVPSTVVVEEGRVAAVVPAGQPVAPRPGDWDVDAAGRLVVPGSVDAHTHLALGSLARLAGLPGQAPQVQERWRTALRSGVEPRASAPVVEALTAAGAAMALKAGVTCAFDLLRAAPGRAGESLEAAGRALDRLGLRAVLAYAASDRAGPGEGRGEVRAAADFAAARQAHPTVRGAAGLDGLDAAPDELLAALAAPAARHGLLASVGEDDTDLTAAFFRGSMRPLDFLHARGLLGERTVVAHGSTTAREEGARLVESGATLCATPRSAAFWGAPLPPVAELGAAGAFLALGSDGLFPDVACELISVTLFHRSQARSPRAAEDLAADVLWPGGARLAGRFFGGTFGAIAPGAVADLVVLDWRPAVPLPDLPQGDLAILWAGAPAAWTIVGGEVRLREGRLLGVDEAEVAARAREAAARLLT